MQKCTMSKVKLSHFKYVNIFDEHTHVYIHLYIKMHIEFYLNGIILCKLFHLLLKLNGMLSAAFLSVNFSCL